MTLLPEQELLGASQGCIGGTDDHDADIDIEFGLHRESAGHHHDQVAMTAVLQDAR